MSLDWIRASYGVPAKRGGRIEYTGSHQPRMGTITGARDGHLLIRLDGNPRSTPFHPTWELRYTEAGRALLSQEGDRG